MKLRTMCALCASSVLAVAAIAAQGASAQTAFECASTASGATFNDAHCKETKAGGAGFQHVSIAENKPFSTSVTNTTTGTATSPLKLKTVISSTTLELEAAMVSGSFSLENKSAGMEMWTEGKGKLTLEKVIVSQPAANGCTVSGSGGTEGLLPSTEAFLTNRGRTNEWELTEVPGAKNDTLFEYRVENCKIAALNGGYLATGNIRVKTHGTTLDFVHEEGTNQKTLKVNKQNAGFSGELTLKVAGTGNGIALT